MPVHHHGRELEDGKGDNHDGHETWVQSKVGHTVAEHSISQNIWIFAPKLLRFHPLNSKLNFWRENSNYLAYFYQKWLLPQCVCFGGRIYTLHNIHVEFPLSWVPFMAWGVPKIKELKPDKTAVPPLAKNFWG